MMIAFSISTASLVKIFGRQKIGYFKWVKELASIMSSSSIVCPFLDKYSLPYKWNQSTLLASVATIDYLEIIGVLVFSPT